MMCVCVGGYVAAEITAIVREMFEYLVVSGSEDLDCAFLHAKHSVVPSCLRGVRVEGIPPVRKDTITIGID